MEAVNRSPDDIVSLEKLAKGGFNCTFLITMHCGFQMVACIPYPAMIPKYFAVARGANCTVYGYGCTFYSELQLWAVL